MQLERLNLRDYFGKNRLLLIIFLAFIPCSFSISSVEIKGKEAGKQLIGHWMGNGNHWRFQSGGWGIFATYRGHSHYPIDGEFSWRVEDRSLVIPFDNESPWPGRIEEYKIRKLTNHHLVLGSVSVSGETLNLERADD